MSFEAFDTLVDDFLIGFIRGLIVYRRLDQKVTRSLELEIIYCASLSGWSFVHHDSFINGLPDSLHVEFFRLFLCLGLVIVGTISLRKNAFNPPRRLQSRLILVPHIIDLLLEQVLKVEFLDTAEFVPYVGADALSGRLLLG